MVLLHGYVPTEIRLTQQEKTEIVRAYTAESEKLADIAKRYDRTPAAICKVLRKEGIPALRAPRKRP